MKKVNIKGQVTKVYTIGELATILYNRKAITLRKYEDRGILPRSNYRLPSVTLKDGSVREGQRIYTQYLVDLLLPIFKEFTQGVQITEEQKQTIREAFVAEKNKFNNT